MEKTFLERCMENIKVTVVEGKLARLCNFYQEIVGQTI